MPGEDGPHRSIYGTDTTSSRPNTAYSKSRQAYSTRKHASEESHASSRFDEAMRNPDWRRRGTPDISFTSSYTDSSSYELPPFNALPQQHDSIANSEENTKLQYDDSIASGNLADRSAPIKEDPEPKGLDQHKSLASTTDSHFKRALCQVISHVELPTSVSKDKPISIIELLPVGSTSTSNHRSGTGYKKHHSSIVEIQRVDTKQQQFGRSIGNVQEDQFAAVLRTLERTPRHIKASNQTREGSPDSLVAAFAELNPFRKAHRAVMEDPAVADVGRSFHNPESRGIKPQAVTSVKDEAMQPSGNESAFQKMLQKLQRGKDVSRASVGFKEAEKNVPSASHEQHQLQKPGQAPQGGARRKGIRTTAFSDPILRVEHTNVNLATKNPIDQIPCIDHDAKSKTWNPRAREFLSFTEETTSPKQKCQQSGPRKHIDTIFGKEGRKDGSGDDISATRDSNSEANLPFPLIPVSLPTLDSLGMAMPGLGSMPFGPMFLPNLGPGGQQVPALGALPAVNFGSALTMPFPAAGNFPFSSLPYTDTSFLQSNMAGSNPGPYNWGCGPAGNMHHPLPVPKPRQPDPSNQQAYEAWIEWRKANEPGYALECKLRQQKRAQKNRSGKSKIEIKAPPEATTAA